MLTADEHVPSYLYELEPCSKTIGVDESIFLSRVEGSMSRVEGTMSRVIFFQFFFIKKCGVVVVV